MLPIPNKALDDIASEAHLVKEIIHGFVDEFYE